MATEKPRHQLTTEERRLGQARGAATRREQGKSFRQRLAEKMDERADEIIQNLLSAGVTDWRATIAASAEAYGKPTERTELTGADGEPLRVTHERRLTLADVAAFADSLDGPQRSTGGELPDASPVAEPPES